MLYKSAVLYSKHDKIIKMYGAAIQRWKIEYFHIQSSFLYLQLLRQKRKRV